MNYIGELTEIIGKFGSAGEILARYSGELIIAGIVFALLNCFFGYKLRKLWITVTGLVLGAGVGGGVGYYFLKDVKLSAVIALGGGVILALMIYHMYRGGLFLLCGGMTYLALQQLISGDTAAIRGVCMVAGIIVGILALQYEMIIVILTTGLCGGVGAVQGIFKMMGWDGTIPVILLGIILGALGIFFQYQQEPKERRQTVRENQKPLIQSLGKSKRRKKKSGRNLRDYLPAFRKKKKKGGRGGSVLTGNSIKGNGGSGTGSVSNSNRKPLRENEDAADKSSPLRGKSNLGLGSDTSDGGLHTANNYHVLDFDDINAQISQDIKKIVNDQKEGGV